MVMFGRSPPVCVAFPDIEVNDTKTSVFRIAGQFFRPLKRFIPNAFNDEA